jgi:hypothetical protein
MVAGLRMSDSRAVSRLTATAKAKLTKVTQANIAAERRAAQNAAANDEITLANTYHNEFVMAKKGYLRYWFVCMAGGTDPCLPAITSKMWDRKFKDLSATKNEWTCSVCCANYLTQWGVFVEIQIDGKIYCLRATIPDDHTLDIKAMDLERKLKEGFTPQELYDAIPVVAPKTTQYIETRDAAKGLYRLINMDSYLALPQWKWAQVLEIDFDEVAK